MRGGGKRNSDKANLFYLMNCLYSDITSFLKRGRAVFNMSSHGDSKWSLLARVLNVLTWENKKQLYIVLKKKKTFILSPSLTPPIFRTTETEATSGRRRLCPLLPIVWALLPVPYITRVTLSDSPASRSFSPLPHVFSLSHLPISSFWNTYHSLKASC